MEKYNVTKGLKDGEKVELPEINLNDASSTLHLNFNQISEGDLTTLAFLKEILSKFDIELDVTHHIYDEKHAYDSVFIHYKRENMLKKATRNAGRKKDFEMAYRYKECTVSELKMKLDSGRKKSDIIAELGCPRTTFYRILRNLGKEIDLDLYGSDSIWMYTN